MWRFVPAWPGPLLLPETRQRRLVSTGPAPSADVHGYAPAFRSTASMWCPYRESPLLHTAPSTHMATR